MFMFTVHYKSDGEAQFWFVEENLEKALQLFEICEEVHNVEATVHTELGEYYRLYKVKAISDYRNTEHEYWLDQETFAVGRQYS